MSPLSTGSITFDHFRPSLVPTGFTTAAATFEDGFPFRPRFPLAYVETQQELTPCDQGGERERPFLPLYFWISVVEWGLKNDFFSKLRPSAQKPIAPVSVDSASPTGDFILDAALALKSVDLFSRKAIAATKLLPPVKTFFS